MFSYWTWPLITICPMVPPYTPLRCHEFSSTVLPTKLNNPLIWYKNLTKKKVWHRDGEIVGLSLSPNWQKRHFLTFINQYSSPYTLEFRVHLILGLEYSWTVMIKIRCIFIFICFVLLFDTWNPFHITRQSQPIMQLYFLLTRYIAIDIFFLLIWKSKFRSLIS